MAQFDASRRGNKMLNSSRGENEGTYRRVVWRGEEGPLFDPGSELLLGGSARVVALRG